MHRAKGDRFVRASELPVRQCRLLEPVTKNFKATVYSDYIDVYSHSTVANSTRRRWSDCANAQVDCSLMQE